MKYPYFATLKEFLITQPKTVVLSVADKLYQFHIIPMDKVRKELGVWITASAKSGNRPVWYEKSKGRSGNSQHTFIDEWINGSGAVDWTCKDFKKNKDKLLSLIIEKTKYTRICVYRGFIHCDYKSDNRQLFNYNETTKKWEFIKNI